MSGTPSLLINESWWTRRLSLAINTGPSEKIHSQIRRPSFSDSLLTRIRWRSLAQLKNTIWAPNVHFHAPAVFQIRKCFRHPVKIRSVGQTISFARRRREGVAGTHHSVCRGRSVSRLSPSPSLQVFVSASLQLSAVCGKGATSAPKSAEGALRGRETIPFMQPSTIRRYCAHHSRSYFSHPDEEGERQFRFAPFGHSWKKASARGSVGASLTIQSWPPTHFLAKESTGRRISAQRQLLRGGARYSALHRLHTTTLQSGPVWKKILSPLQMNTPYEI